MTAPRVMAPGSAELASDALVVFGFTGYLATKKIFPALYAMGKKKMLTVPVIGVASTSLDSEQMHERVRDSLERAGGIDDAAALERLLSLLRYVRGDYKQPQTFQQLKAVLGDAVRPAHYLAIPPALFENVIQSLGRPEFLTARASSWKNRSAATSRRRSRSTPPPTPSSPSRRSSGSTTTSARRRS